MVPSIENVCSSADFEMFLDKLPLDWAFKLSHFEQGQEAGQFEAEFYSLLNENHIDEWLEVFSKHSFASWNVHRANRANGVRNKYKQTWGCSLSNRNKKQGIPRTLPHIKWILKKSET